MPEPRPLWKRPSVVVAATMLAITGIALGVWLIRPLFVDTVVDEAFPTETAASAEPADVDSVVVKPPPTDTAGASEEREAAESDEDADPVALLAGSFVDADDSHHGSGTATIYRLPSGRDILRFEDFDVTNGPDLHVLLVPVAAPESSGDVHTEGYVDLGKLKGNQGDQNYDLPSSIDLSSGTWSVAIYCDPFSVIFATASLTG